MIPFCFEKEKKHFGVLFLLGLIVIGDCVYNSSYSKYCIYSPQ